MVGNSEVIQRLHESLIGLEKRFTSFFRMCPDRLSRPAPFETGVALKIVRIEFLETCQIKKITLNHMFIMFKNSVEYLFFKHLLTLS